MFEGTLVESTPMLRSRNGWPVAISVTAQLLLAALCIAIPLLHPELLPNLARSAHLSVPMTRPAPIPPPRIVHIASESISVPAPIAFTAPRQLPASLFHSDAPPIDAGPIALEGTARGPALPGALLAGAPAAPHITTTRTRSSTAHAGPTRISSGVSAGLLLEPIRPVYPRLAQAAHQQGTVVVKATISGTGRIESAHILSGPMLLQEAALQAVRGARYRPFLLNGQPTAVETTVSITFRLSN